MSNGEPIRIFHILESTVQALQVSTLTRITYINNCKFPPRAKLVQIY